MTALNRIKVVIDSDLEDLIPSFLEHRQQDVGKARQALSAEDYDAIRIIGHSIKGVGGGYGFDRITEIGAEMEQVAQDRQADRVADSIDALADYLARIDVEFS